MRLFDAHGWPIWLYQRYVCVSDDGNPNHTLVAGMPLDLT
jgi:hypothetical protein